MSDKEFRINAQKYKMMNVADIIDHPMNPNEGNVEVVEGSIEKNGFYGAVVIQQSSGYLLKGHTTRRAAVEQGAKQIPAIIVDVDDDTALSILLADNRTAQLAIMNDEKLSRVLQQLKQQKGNIEGSAYSEDYLSNLLKRLQPEKKEQEQEDVSFQSFTGDEETNCTCPKCGFAFNAPVKAKAKS